MHFSPCENELGELMMPMLISPHAYDEEDKRKIPNLKPQFYIQLVNRPYFGTGILLFGLFGQSWQ